MTDRLFKAATRRAARMRVPGSLVQDCAVEFLEKMLLLEERYPEVPWPLYDESRWVSRCITNHVIDFKRHLDSRAAHEVPWSQAAPADTENLVARGRSPEAHALAEEMGRYVARALARMTLEQRELYVSHHIRYRSIASIAQETGHTETAIAMRLFRTRQRLLSLLEDFGLDDEMADDYLRLIDRSSG